MKYLRKIIAYLVLTSCLSACQYSKSSNIEFTLGTILFEFSSVTDLFENAEIRLSTEESIHLKGDMFSLKFYLLNGDLSEFFVRDFQNTSFNRYHYGGGQNLYWGSGPNGGIISLMTIFNEEDRSSHWILIEGYASNDYIKLEIFQSFFKIDYSFFDVVP